MGWLRPPCRTAPPPTERTQRKIFDADCTTSYVLNSGVTEANLTKFLYVVQKWLPITPLKSKLQSSNPFGNDKVRNEDRRQIAGASRQKLRVLNSEITGQKFTKFGHDVAWLPPLNPLKADLRSADSLSNAEAKSKSGPTRRLRTSATFNWLP